LTVAVLAVVLACSDAAAPNRVAGPEQQSGLDNGLKYVPGSSWRTASPSALGFDSTRIEQLRHDALLGRYGSLHGLIVVRYGYVAVQDYFGWPPNTPHTMQSVTKSVTSLVFGIASGNDNNTLRLDRPVLDVLGRYQGIQNIDSRKSALTLDHLLLMRTDMDFWEQPYDGSPLDQLNRSKGDWVQFILDRPMTGQPGSRWAYNSGAPILICGAIREAGGAEADVLARMKLFEPIGVTGETWYHSPYDGLPHCGGGLSLKALDLARVGYLVLRRGRWGDRVIVREGWLDSTATPVTRPVPGVLSGFNPGYGRFWWIFPTTRGGQDAGVIAAWGHGGQWLFVVPSLDLVVAIIAQDGAGIDLLYDGILPALARSTP
jgi:CubicO group peptidase (beta-lactamase class C family)